MVLLKIEHIMKGIFLIVVVVVALFFLWKKFGSQISGAFGFSE